MAYLRRNAPWSASYLRTTGLISPSGRATSAARSGTSGAGTFFESAFVGSFVELGLRFDLAGRPAVLGEADGRRQEKAGESEQAE